MGGKYDANSFTSKPHSGKYFYKRLSIPSFHTAWALSGPRAMTSEGPLLP